MRSWTSRLVTASLICITACLLPTLTGTVARGQIRIPAEAGASDDAVSPILQRGQQLERERRWSEAVGIYEDAVKNFPERRDLHDRAILARAHFDVTRRYGDDSFSRSLNATEEKTLETYVEVLQKINTHYVTTPNWHDLLRRGTFMLEVAMTEAVFLNKHLSHVPAEQINAFRTELRRTTDAQLVRNRFEARDAVAAASRLAQRRLQLSSTAVVMEYICGAMSALDEYSGFLTAAQLEDVFSQIEGNFVGLGIELKAENQALLIVNVIAGSPADKGGLRKNDRIVGVDGKSTRDIPTDTAADMLKGPENSVVSVDVESVGRPVRKLQLLRERVDVPSVEEVKIVDKESGVGYFRLTSFQKTTSRDVDAALWNLNRQGMKSLIIDVRGNPGGLLTASVEVADKFLTAGTIVRTHGRNQSEDFDYKAHSAATWKTPLVVLIDGDSASASEIFAGAIRDHQRGKIVGQRSYGKGSVQGIFPLGSSESGVRITTAKFFSPSGQAISQRGVMPDIVVPAAKPTVASKPVIDGNTIANIQPVVDAALNAGVQTARGLSVSQRP